MAPIDKMNLFAQSFAGGGMKVAAPQAQTTAPITPTKEVGAGGNPFNPGAKYKDDGAVGLGIADGAVQTSAAQMGKKPMPMRQLGIG